MAKKVNNIKIGSVAYSKKGNIYIFLGYRTVASAYNTDKSPDKCKPQTVETWFSHSHFPRCNENGKIISHVSDDLLSHMQLWTNNFSASHAWDYTFITTVKPQLNLFGLSVIVNENAIIDHFREIYKDIQGYRHESHRHRARYYLCFGEWSRKKIIDEILNDI